MKQQKETDIVFLLDRSGSMGGLESDTIGGYNSYIASQKSKNAKVTTVLFDDQYEIIYQRKRINEIKPLTKKQYFVRGCTALFDAIGKTIELMEKENPKKLLFIITTDGLENASTKYTKSQIKELIEGHKNWEFMFIGANIDSYEEGNSIGICRKNIANCKKDKKGLRSLFQAISKATILFQDEEELSEDWKKDLEQEKRL